jgi:hypothetical protein
VSGYTIEWSTTAAFTTVAGSLATGSTALTGRVNVARGFRATPNPAAYFFRVRATNAVGTGTPSVLAGPVNTL